MIPRELEQTILRLHLAEHWPPNTIASQLGVHHEVVERVIRQALAPQARKPRPSLLDPYLPFVLETWERYPRLPASRLFTMCKERGYPGHADHFRHAVAPYRPRPAAEPFLRLRTLPGEQAQVDWAHFGKITIGRAVRPLVAFVFVLSWSRALFLRFFVGQAMENFLRGHVEAFERWGGVPRVVLYDNLKSAVLERVGDAIRYNPTLLDLAAHYRFEPRPVAPARGNEKARVERAIGHIRTGFFLARAWRGLEDLNGQADEWTAADAGARRCPEDTTLTIARALDEERPRLLALPDNPFPTDERREVSVQKTPYVRFDANDYSVPHELVRKSVVLVASPDTVRVLDGTQEVARHVRSYDKGRQIEDPAHIEGLVAAKRAARQHRGMDQLAHAAPASRRLLERLAERGANLGLATRKLLELLDLYGHQELEAALTEVLERDAPHVHGVRQVLESRRRLKGLDPVQPIPLPDDPRLRDLRVRPHDLAGYDSLTGPSSQENPHDPGTPSE